MPLNNISPIPSPPILNLYSHSRAARARWREKWGRKRGRANTQWHITKETWLSLRTSDLRDLPVRSYSTTVLGRKLGLVVPLFLEENLEGCERKGRRQRYLPLLPFLLLMLVDQSLPHGALSSTKCSGCVTHIFGKSELHILPGERGGRSQSLGGLNWFGTVPWHCCDSFRVHVGGFAETQIHCIKPERPRSVGLSLVVGSPGNKWLKSPRIEQSWGVNKLYEKEPK